MKFKYKIGDLVRYYELRDTHHGLIGIIRDTYEAWQGPMYTVLFYDYNTVKCVEKNLFPLEENRRFKDEDPYGEEYWGEEYWGEQNEMMKNKYTPENHVIKEIKPREKLIEIIQNNRQANSDFFL